MMKRKRKEKGEIPKRNCCIFTDVGVACETSRVCPAPGRPGLGRSPEVGQRTLRPDPGKRSPRKGLHQRREQPGSRLSRSSCSDGEPWAPRGSGPDYGLRPTGGASGESSRVTPHPVVGRPRSLPGQAGLWNEVSGVRGATGKGRSHPDLLPREGQLETGPGPRPPAETPLSTFRGLLLSSVE